MEDEWAKLPHDIADGKVLHTASDCVVCDHCVCVVIYFGCQDNLIVCVSIRFFKKVSFPAADKDM